jgi:hypothetical protein
MDNQGGVLYVGGRRLSKLFFTGFRMDKTRQYGQKGQDTPDNRVCERAIYPTHSLRVAISTE